MDRHGVHGTNERKKVYERMEQDTRWTDKSETSTAFAVRTSVGIVIERASRACLFESSWFVMMASGSVANDVVRLPAWFVGMTSFLSERLA